MYIKKKLLLQNFLESDKIVVVSTTKSRLNKSAFLPIPGYKTVGSELRGSDSRKELHTLKANQANERRCKPLNNWSGKYVNFWNLNFFQEASGKCISNKTLRKWLTREHSTSRNCWDKTLSFYRWVQILTIPIWWPHVHMKGEKIATECCQRLLV